MTLSILPSQLLRESRDAMLELLDCGVVLYMNRFRLVANGNVTAQMVNPEAPRGSVCAVCAGGAWAEMHGGSANVTSEEEKALDDFRCGEWSEFVGHFRDDLAIEDVLEDLPRLSFSGLITDPVPLFDHFDQAIGLLRKAGL